MLSRSGNRRAGTRPPGRVMLEVEMNVRVDENRFLSVACEPEERVVFDRQEKQYHLLRESAARLWDEIGEAGRSISPP